MPMVDSIVNNRQIKRLAEYKTMGQDSVYTASGYTSRHPKKGQFLDEIIRNTLSQRGGA